MGQSFLRRIRTDFKGFLITFGKVAKASDDPAAPDERPIEVLNQLAEQQPDVAEAARYLTPS